MAKKKSKANVGQILTLVAILLGIVAVVMMFVSAIGVKDSDVTYTGLQVAFGFKEATILGGEVIVFNFSFMNLLTYVLATVGVVFAILGIIGKGSKFASLISAIAFVASGVFFFMTISFSIPNEDVSAIINLKDAYVLGVGSIIGGIVSIISGICCLANVVIENK